jgi:hypothetical protein
MEEETEAVRGFRGERCCVRWTSQRLSVENTEGRSTRLTLMARQSHDRHGVRDAYAAGGEATNSQCTSEVDPWEVSGMTIGSYRFRSLRRSSTNDELT